jgi:NAD-dependent SIR2 family protein deacetylase
MLWISRKETVQDTKLSLENAQCPNCLNTGMKKFFDVVKLGDISGISCLSCGEEFAKEEIEEFNEVKLDD